MSTIVQWSSEYELGFSEIDEQHQELFRLINQLWVGLVMRLRREDLSGILVSLQRYIDVHFAAEEQLMALEKYSELELHRRSHSVFVERISQAVEAHGKGEEISLSLLSFLRDWLVQHIQVEDRAYSEHIRQCRTRPDLLRRLFVRPGG